MFGNMNDKVYATLAPFAYNIIETCILDRSDYTPFLRRSHESIMKIDYFSMNLRAINLTTSRRYSVLESVKSLLHIDTADVSIVPTFGNRIYLRYRKYEKNREILDELVTLLSNDPTTILTIQEVTGFLSRKREIPLDEFSVLSRTEQTKT